MNLARPTLALAAAAAAVLGLGAVQLAPGVSTPARADGLLGYSGCAELLAYYRTSLSESASAWGWEGSGVFNDSATSASGARSSAPAAAGADSGLEVGAVGSGDTGTNVQEQGVDEPDLAKLQDGRIVTLVAGRLRVLSAEDDPQELGSLRIGAEAGYGGELLLVGDRALVLVPGWRQPDQSPTSGGVADAGRSMGFWPGTPTTTLVLVDLAGDRPIEVERAELGAQYVSARLSDGTVRLVTTRRPTPAVFFPGVASSASGAGARTEKEALAANRRAADSIGLADVLPQIERRAADGAVLESGPAVGCEQTVHARRNAGASTLLVTTLRPAEGLAATDRTAVTTDGDLVYAGPDRLVVATSRWGTGRGDLVAVDSTGAGTATSTAPGLPDEVTTELHTFDTSSATATTYLASGSVPGFVLGRWALSRHDGALRVATTRQPPWTADGAGGETSSMVVVLTERDGDLVETGRVEGLGRTEQIRAVRYFGDLAAVVTFRQTDPLYLLDLSGTPRVLGELKVPGFSTYLHPLGNGLLLGLGQDATEDGQVTGSQVSVFDVSDLSRPRIVDRLPLGQGWSPAMDDSRAFGYDPASRTATFGFTRYDVETGGSETSSALGIAVAQDGSLSMAGALELDPGTWPQRVLRDSERVYAVTDTGLVTGDAATLTRSASMRFAGGGGSTR